MKDIRKLQEISKHAVYTDEIVGVVTDGYYDFLREQFKKTNSKS